MFFPVHLGGCKIEFELRWNIQVVPQLFEQFDARVALDGRVVKTVVAT